MCTLSCEGRRIPFGEANHRHIFCSICSMPPVSISKYRRLKTLQSTRPGQATTLVQPVLATAPNEPVVPLANDDTDTVSTSMPDDRYAGQQWSLHATSEFAGASGLFNAREFLAVASEVVVAIVDSGVMLEHEDLVFLPTLVTGSTTETLKMMP